MKKQKYVSPDFTKVVFTSRNDILNGSGYTQFSLFGTDGIGDDSNLDSVMWGQ